MTIDKFDPELITRIVPGQVIDSYCCMHDDIRKVFLVKSVRIFYKDGKNRLCGRSGFFSFGQSLWFLSDSPLPGTSVLPIESAFVCMSFETPSKLFKDAFPETPEEWMTCTVASSSTIHSTPSMLFSWNFKDTVPLIHDEDLPLEADYHVDVKAAAASINKYMRRPLVHEKPREQVELIEPVSPSTEQFVVATPLPVMTGPQRKRTRDAREFREKILSTGAQAEFFVWNHIKAVYGESADLSWWVSSAKRQFFPHDMTPIDDGLGSDFIIPSDSRGLFGSRKGSTVHVEVKGTGGRIENGELSFEVSRNELQRARETNQPDGPDEYVVVVISSLNSRPKLEAVIRDLDSLEMTPTRFLASIPRSAGTGQYSQPVHTKSSWY